MTMTAAAQNDARPPVRCEVLRAIHVDGKRVEPGELVEPPFYLAVDAQSVGKVRIVE
jgi:hypothetical protein